MDPNCRRKLATRQSDRKEYSSRPNTTGKFSHESYILGAYLELLQRMIGFFYPVCFGPKMNTRKYFAPLNGDLKPDTEEVRELLKESGWVESDSDERSVSDDDNGSLYSESSS